jgi:hypothetical protein
MKMIKTKRPSAGLITLLAGWLFMGAAAQAQEVKDVLGDYEVFLTNNMAKHEAARILVLRSGKVGSYHTYGLAIVTNTGGGDIGDGLLCEQATLILDRTAITCTKLFRNPNGLVIGEESLTVAVTGSPYCTALQDTLSVPEKDKIADTSDSNCDKDAGNPNEQCICYDLKARGSTSFGPPSAGSGSGRRD